MQIEFTSHIRMFNAWLWLTAYVLSVLALFGVACTVPTKVTVEEAREHALNRAIMCPVCPGESIDQSQNDLSVSMRQIVKEQIENGKSDQEIKEYFVKRYGVVVLLEPPTYGKGLIVWLVPPIGLLAAVLVLILALILMRRRGGDHMRADHDQKALSQEDRQRYMNLIKRYRHLRYLDLSGEKDSE